MGGGAQHALRVPLGVEHAAHGGPQLRPARARASIAKILIPAAFPSILTGLKIGWAFAWRTLIAAELVFGVSSGKGGLGWYIYENKNMLDIPAVFAGLFTVILIGLIVENLIFRNIEAATCGGGACRPDASRRSCQSSPRPSPGLEAGRGLSGTYRTRQPLP